MKKRKKSKHVSKKSQKRAGKLPPGLARFNALRAKLTSNSKSAERKICFSLPTGSTSKRTKKSKRSRATASSKLPFGMRKKQAAGEMSEQQTGGSTMGKSATGIY